MLPVFSRAQFVKMFDASTLDAAHYIIINYRKAECAFETCVVCNDKIDQRKGYIYHGTVEKPYPYRYYHVDCAKRTLPDGYYKVRAAQWVRQYMDWRDNIRVSSKRLGNKPRTRGYRCTCGDAQWATICGYCVNRYDEAAFALYRNPHYCSLCQEYTPKPFMVHFVNGDMHYGGYEAARQRDGNW